LLFEGDFEAMPLQTRDKLSGAPRPRPILEVATLAIKPAQPVGRAKNHSRLVQQANQRLLLVREGP